MPTVNMELLEESRRHQVVQKYEVYPLNTSDVEDYQIKLTGMASSVKDDARIIQNDSLDQWIESIGNAWSKLANLKAKTPQTVLGLSGNPSSNNIDDGDATFNFFDDAFLTIEGLSGLTNAGSPQTTPTYDTSGQVVHPDIVYFSTAWNGYKYWMGMTPYPNGNDAFENPSILASNDGMSWEVPAGLVNPLESAPGVGHNCDVDLVYNDTTNELWLYYLEKATGADPDLYYCKSSDGINWTNKAFLLDLGGHAVNPAIVKQGINWYMWYVNPGANGCSSAATTVYYRTSADGINWGAAQAVTISQSGYLIWHLDVIYVSSKSEYWMIFTAYPSGSTCSSSVIFFAKSTNRLNWTTYKNKALGISSDWDNKTIYRSSVLYDSTNNKIKVWYSSSNTGGTWNVGYTDKNYDDFLVDIDEDIDAIWNIDCENVSACDGELSVEYVATEWSPRIRAKKSFSNDYALRTRIRPNQTTGTHFFGMTSLTSCVSLIANGEMAALEPYEDGNIYSATVHLGAMTVISQGAYNTDYHIYDINRLSNKVYFYKDGTLLETQITNIPTGDIYPFIGARRAGGKQVCDWILVRKFTENEPIISTISKLNRAALIKTLGSRL